MIAENEPQGDGLEDVKLLTVKDLTKCLRISVRQCWRFNRDGLIPAPQRIGARIIRWNAAEVAAWLRAGSPPRERWNWQREQKNEMVRTAQ